MPGWITNKDWNFESSLDNISEELAWVKKQIQRELTDLQKDVQADQIKKSFFETKWEKVEYHMDLVKQYLWSCIQREDFQINSAVVMAVQILLESKWYEVWNIDWLLKKSSWQESDTEKAIKRFQGENGLRKDWVPGKKTIQKLLDLVWNVKNWDDEVANEEKDKNDKKDDEKREIIETEDSIESTSYTEEELFALEIYRWKYKSPDEEMKRRWYDEKDKKEVWDLVKNKEKMEEMDKILPNFVRWQESDIWKSEEQNDSDDPISENLQWNNVQIVENEGWNQDLNEENEEPVIAENMVVEPKFNEKNKFYLTNRQDYIDNTDILQWPKLEAESPAQVWWIGSSMMQWFAGNVFKNMNWIVSATTRSNERFWKEWEKWVLDEGKLKKYCDDNWIKSFMFYFWWNEAASSQTAVDNAYNDIKLMWEYLQSIWVQPVLCTCIWETKKEHSVWHLWKEYPLVEFNQKIRALWKEKKWPVIDYASIDIWNVRYATPDKTHPDGEYYDMRQKILENLSN